MRLTDFLLYVMIGVIAAAGAAAIVTETQNEHAQKRVLTRVQDEVRSEQRALLRAIESLGRTVGAMRNDQHAYFAALGQSVGAMHNEQHAYFAALGQSVGAMRNKQDALWPAVDGYLQDLDTSLIALRDNVTAASSALGVAHSPTDIDINSLDNYDELDQNWKSFRDTSDRTRVGCQALGGTAVLVTLGQSNAANYAAVRYTPKHDVLNFNLYDGRCYEARDPLLGTSGTLGNFATPLADMLIERGVYTRVIIAPIAMGGSTVEEWADEGVFNRRLLVLIRRLFDAGLTPTAILWHQGEGNSGVGDSHGRQYRKDLREVIATFRTYDIQAPFFVALASKCGGYPRPGGDNIRDGQAATVNHLENVFPGPDTDTLGDQYRDKEHCHFNAQGLLRHAAMWADVLQSWAGSKRRDPHEATER
jgi:Carbohydrate esterase, sialic acid-specific acetylesterase